MNENTTQLLEYRKSIDNLDAALIFLLAERFRITEQVGILKKDGDLPAADPNREKKQIERLLKLSEGSELRPEFISRFMELITAEVKQRHTDIKNGDNIS